MPVDKGLSAPIPEGVVVFRVFVSLTVILVVATFVLAGCATPTAVAVPLFTGDYATGDFSQWPVVQTRAYNDSGKDYVPSYSARIVQDATKGNVARFEVRAGDVPGFGGGERSEVQGGPDTGGAEGEMRWYRFATKFDPSFPLNHADLGWGVTDQWHASDANGSPPVSWTVDVKNGYWSLTIEKQSAPGAYVQTIPIFETPLNVGQWHDVTMQINWSASDEKGWIRLWHNGIRQTFVNGADTYFVRTLVPGTTGVYYKEGMYREPTNSTDIVYHTGFHVAGSEDAL
jgi:hypothetical protein